MKSINVSLRQMRAFVTLAAHTNFRRAADVLGISQSALSATIQQIETELGVVLFDRTTRRVELTAVGSNLLPTFERLIADVDMALEDARAEAAGARGRVVVTAPLSVVINAMPTVVGRFVAKFPGVKVVVLDQTLRESYRSLQQNEADIAVCGLSDLDDELDFHLLGSDRYHALLPVGHVLATKTQVRWEELVAHPFVSMTRGTQIRDLMETAIQRHKLTLKPLCEVSGPMAVEAMVRAGLGVGALPRAAITSDLESRPLVDPVLERQIGVVLRQGRSLSPAAEAFRLELEAYYGERA